MSDLAGPTPRPDPPLADDGDGTLLPLREQQPLASPLRSLLRMSWESGPAVNAWLLEEAKRKQGRRGVRMPIDYRTIRRRGRGRARGDDGILSWED